MKVQVKVGQIYSCLTAAGPKGYRVTSQICPGINATSRAFVLEPIKPNTGMWEAFATEAVHWLIPFDEVESELFPDWSLIENVP